VRGMITHAFCVAAACGPIRTKLDPTLTSLMRRQPELIELATLLSRARMVTLTDLGELASHSLHLAVASEVGETFLDGVSSTSPRSVTRPAFG